MVGWAGTNTSCARAIPVRPGPRGARAIGLQSGRLRQRARGLDAAGNLPNLLRFQRRGHLAELPLRLEAWRSISGQSVPGDRRGRTHEAGRARPEFWRPTHTETDDQGVVGSR